MTSTQSDRGPVFVEFPDFGYGPASTVLALMSGIYEDFAWHVVSTGGAAAFARHQLPDAAYHDLDTFDPSAWPEFGRIAPPGSLVVSCTNPEFAAWAIRHGYRVGVVDTLDWMWPTLPDAIDDSEFHLVQAYFATQAGRGQYRRREVIRPIVDPRLWPARVQQKRPGTALIGFGGMHLPGGEDLVAAYVRWLLAAALPVLVDYAGATDITIAGGQSDLAALVPEWWRAHPAVRVRAALDRGSYAELAQTAEQLVISPGLTSIYECAASSLTPLLQPGFSMSMILQLRNVATTGYPHVAAWPWLAEAARAVAGMPEADGVRHVASRIVASVRDADPGGETVGKALMRYVDRAKESPPLRVPVDPGLPDGATLLAAHLSRLT